jgi:hypothetical protein
MMENPTKALGERVHGEDNAREVCHDNIAGAFPFLDSEVLDIDMTRAFGGTGGIDHGESSLVVAVKAGGASLMKAQVAQDRPEVFGSLGSGDARDEFSLSRAGGDRTLDLGSVGNGSAGKGKCITSHRATSSPISGVGSVKIRNEDQRIRSLWEGGQRVRVEVFHNAETTAWEVRERTWTPVDESPIGRHTEVFREADKSFVVNFSWRLCMSSKGSNSGANIEATDDITIEHLT